MAKAIVALGSKQHEVVAGQKILVDRLAKTPGETFESDRVVLISADGEAKAVVGKPTIKDAKVLFKVLRHLRGEKVIAFKKRSKKAWKKKQGFRADLTELLVEEVKVG